jgi:hypothetical protein
VTSVQRIETANSVWYFDEERSLFRRVPRDAEEVFAPSDNWERYFGLERDAETGAFTVLLDPDGTRRYRSWSIEGETETEETAPLAEPPTEELKLLPAPD